METFNKMVMKKGVFFLFLVLLSVQIVAAETTISETPITPVVIKELSIPASYNLVINNDNPFSDRFIINTLLDMVITPTESVLVLSGEKKGLVILVNPSEEFKASHDGRFSFEYFVKGDNSGLVKDNMIIGIFSFEDATEILLPPALDAEDSSITISFRLKEDLELDSSVTVESKLFSDEFDLKLTNEAQEVTFDVDLSGVTAGVYTIEFTFDIDGEVVSVEKDLVLSPVVDIQTKEVKSGSFLSRKITLTKVNNGNSATEVTIALNRTVLSSLFTTFTGAPKTQKIGNLYVYEWTQELNPGERIEISLKTNYYLPFIVLLLILIAFVVFKIVTAPDVKISKKTVRVRTKSGAFAAKIIVSIKNTGKTIKNVKVIERLPVFTEVLPDKFGVITPTEIKKRGLVWDFDKLESGEERMFSYIVYSKINVFGKLEVPATVVTYRDEKGDFKESIGEKRYLLSEEPVRKEEF